MGEYEPNDSRNVTGAGNQMGQSGNQSQSGQSGSGQAQSGQPQQFQSGGGQMGGGQTGGQAGGGSGFQGSAAGGLQGGDNRFAGQIREHMEVIGADGVHLGTVDHVDGDRIKLTKRDSGMGSHQGHHHYLPLGLIAEIEGDRVRLSANGDVAYSMIEEANRQ